MSVLDYLKLGAGFIGGFIVCWLIHILIVGNIQAQNIKAIEKLKVDMKAECNNDKTLTTGIDNAFHIKANDLSMRLDNECMYTANSPTMLITGNTSSPHAVPTKSGHAQQNGVARPALISFAGECEGYRLQLIYLQQFVAQTWKAKAN